MNTNFANVTIVPQATQHITRIVKENIDPTNPQENLFENPAVEVIISSATAKTYNALLQKFINTNWKDITITMKNGDEITISAYIAPETEKNIRNAEWFNVYTPTNMFCDSDNLLDVAATLCNYENLLDEQNNESAKLKAFWNRNLKGHSQQELKDGNDIFITYFHKYENLLAEETIAEIAKLRDITEDYCKTVIELAQNWDTYSDWYKSVHQVRPRFSC